jgi:1,4-dihydroxy-2-naphthoate octaprenyltransferase
MLLPFALLPWLAVRPAAWLALLALPATLAVVRRCQQAEGIALNGVLADTARAQFVFGLLLAIGLLV